VTAALPATDRIANAHAVFDGMWERHHDAIYAYCAHLTDAERGADLAQDVFLDAFRALLEGRFDGRNERAWLFTSASRKAIDRARLGWGRFVRGSLERLFGPFFFDGEDDLNHRRAFWRGGGQMEKPSRMHRRAGEAALTAPARWAEPEAALDADELVAAVDEAVRRLPPGYRAVLWLREWQEMDYDQISQTMGVTRSSTKAMLWRARNRFREEWLKQEALA
jgi:RNA polymerase sigma factor (sigma-70 family)